MCTKALKYYRLKKSKIVLQVLGLASLSVEWIFFLWSVFALVTVVMVCPPLLTGLSVFLVAMKRPCVASCS